MLFARIITRGPEAFTDKSLPIDDHHAAVITSKNRLQYERSHPGQKMESGGPT